jgi:hypothetical protein
VLDQAKTSSENPTSKIDRLYHNMVTKGEKIKQIREHRTINDNIEDLIHRQIPIQQEAELMVV